MGSPRVGGAVPRERAGARVGRLQHGVPCADAQRAVSLVFGGRGADECQQPTWTRAPERRRARRQRGAGARTSSLRSTFYDNRVKDPVANVTITPTNPNQLQRQNLGRTRIRGLQTDVAGQRRRLRARLRRVSVQRRQGARIRREPGARRPVPAAGRQAPRLRAGSSMRIRDCSMPPSASRASAASSKTT